MIPGSNLLLQALNMIARTSVTYYRDLGERTQTATGRYVTQYADPVVISNGCVQPVPRNRYENLGLDYQKNYVVWFVAQGVIDLQRNFSGDQIEYDGGRWTLQSKTRWFNLDGWDYVICVQVDGDA